MSKLANDGLSQLFEVSPVVLFLKTNHIGRDLSTLFPNIPKARGRIYKCNGF